MINSMTAFGTARVDIEQGSLTLEIRSVNSRFLDLHFRIPDELRHSETVLRERLTAALGRGKVEVRANFVRAAQNTPAPLEGAWLQHIAQQLDTARQTFPDMDAPRLVELVNWPGQKSNEPLDQEVWGAAMLLAIDQALPQFTAARAREGARLAAVMRDCAERVAVVVATVQTHLPQMLEDHKLRLATKLKETIANAFPGGFTQISGQELSERISQEASLFALRIDVAEELARLTSHLSELQHLLSETPPTGKSASTGGATKRPSGGAGKRLDFLFQEMNREANTLGSKAASLEVTRAAMDLKVLIEQMREQVQNLE